MAYGGSNDDVIVDEGQYRDPENFRVHYLEHGLSCRLDSVTMGHLQEIKKTANIHCGP